MQNPIVKHVVIRQLAQSESQQAIKQRELDEDNNIPWPKVSLRYLSRWSEHENKACLDVVGTN